MRTTFMQKSHEVDRKWFVVDAADKTLGRLSTEVATLLRGKHKPTFTTRRLWRLRDHYQC